MNHTKTNCRTQHGKAVQFIDTFILISGYVKYYIANYDKKMPKALKHAILDLANHEDFKAVVEACKMAQKEDIERLQKIDTEQSYIDLLEYSTKMKVL